MTPHIVLSPEDVSIELGKTAVLDCVAFAEPDPKISKIHSQF